MKKNNINEWMWLLVLFTYVAYFSSILGNQKILLFIHPKMIKYVVFTICVFILLISQQVKKLKTDQGRKLKYSYFIFLFPVLLAVVINPTTLSTKVIANKGINISNQINSLDISVGAAEIVPDSFAESNPVSSGDDSDSTSEPLDTNLPIGTVDSTTDNITDIEVTNQAKTDITDVQTSSTYNQQDDNTEDGIHFLDTLDEINARLPDIIGQEIELIGFIYREDGFEVDQFVISRYVISCCAADAQIYGLLCQYNGEWDLKDDQWVRSTGIIDKTMYKSDYQEEEIEMGLIKVTKIEAVTPPEDPYVYPFQ